MDIRNQHGGVLRIVLIVCAILAVAAIVSWVIYANTGDASEEDVPCCPQDEDFYWVT